MAMMVHVRCPHRPVVEITKSIRIDVKTGEIEIPEGPRFVFRLFPKDKSQGYHPPVEQLAP